MDNDPMFNLAFGNNQPIEGAATIPDINVLDGQYSQEQHKQSEFQRFLRQHDHITTFDDLGLAGYDPALEDKYRPLVPQLDAAEPIEERPGVLRHASTVHNGGFRRYTTPPTTQSSLRSFRWNRPTTSRRHTQTLCSPRQGNPQGNPITSGTAFSSTPGL
jgi:hypothetical protein